MPLPPAKLNDKHRHIALLKLSGATRDEIATYLDYEPTYVSAITESPLFKALMEQLRAEMRHKTIGTVVDRIVSEGPASVNVLVEIRDDDQQSGATRITAARDLLDRNPETAKVSREDRRTETRITLDTRALQRIAGVLAEDAGHVVDAEPAEPMALADTRPAHAGLQTLDQALAELHLQEDSA